MRNWTEQELDDYLKRTGAVRGEIIRADTSNPPFKLPGNQAGRFALGRLPAGTMNKTEKAYSDYLWTLQRAGQVAWFEFEGVKLRLADRTFYTPDFAVMLDIGLMEMHEVKGFWEDDARVKIKVAAAKYPFRFVAAKQRPKKLGGGWEYEEFS